MKKKMTNLLDNFFDWINEKNIHIGNLELGAWTVYSNEGKRIELDLDPDCEHCPFGWDCTSYEGECEDCGCYINYEFDTPKFFCALPRWIKKLIKKVKGWE